MRRMNPHLVALPGQAAAEEEEEGVGQGLEVVPPAGCPAQVRVHAGVPHGPPEDIRPLVVLHVGLAD